MQSKAANYCARLLLGLLLALTLAACGEQNTPTPLPDAPSNPVIAPGKVDSASTIASLQSTTTAASQFQSTTESPQTSITKPGTVAATPAPTPTVSVAAGTLTTQEVLEEIAPADQNTPRPNLNDLPRFNGVPLLPVLNSNTRSVQPPPIIQANYGPNDTPRVGLQIGHYQIDQLPDEQASLRSQTGGSGGGVREVDFNGQIVKQVAALLQAKGVTVDVLPATVPPGYTADVFVAVHADAAPAGNPRGFKIARSRFSAIPQTDDNLTNILYDTYGKATGLPTDSSITRNMTGYYAFNNRRRLYAVSKITPAVIIETGFLTSAADRGVLLGNQGAVARGIADGIWLFLQGRPPLDMREKPVGQAPAITVLRDKTPVYAEGSGTVIAYVSKDQRFEYYEDKGDSYSVFVPLMGKTGYIRKTDAAKTFVPR